MRLRKLLERLDTTVPPGIRELRRSGLAPSTVRALEAHGFDTVAKLDEALASRELTPATLPKRYRPSLQDYIDARDAR